MTELLFQKIWFDDYGMELTQSMKTKEKCPYGHKLPCKNCKFYQKDSNKCSLDPPKEE